jgi:hypothetical protein
LKEAIIKRLIAIVNRLQYVLQSLCKAIDCIAFKTRPSDLKVNATQMQG